MLADAKRVEWGGLRKTEALVAELVAHVEEFQRREQACQDEMGEAFDERQRVIDALDERNRQLTEALRDVVDADGTLGGPVLAAVNAARALLAATDAPVAENAAGGPCGQPWCHSTGPCDSGHLAAPVAEEPLKKRYLGSQGDNSDGEPPADRYDGPATANHDEESCFGFACPTCAIVPEGAERD